MTFVANGALRVKGILRSLIHLGHVGEIFKLVKLDFA